MCDNEQNVRDAEFHSNPDLFQEFTTKCAHEMRTPLKAIEGYTNNMLDGVAGELTERQTRYINRMKSNVNRLTGLVEELLSACEKARN